MRVPTNSASTATIDMLQKLSAQQASLQSKIASNQRVTAPSDDPAGFGRILGLQANNRSAQQFEKNGMIALEISQISFEGLKQLQSVSERTSELAVLAGGVSGETQLDAYAKEINQLIEHALQLGNSRFGGQYLFGGTEVKNAPFTETRDAEGRISAVAYAGEGEAASVRISESSSVTPRPSGETNAGIATFIDQLIALRDAMEAEDTAAVSAMQPGLAEAEDRLIGALSDQGTVQMRIEVNLMLQQAWQRNIEQQVSAEADIDLPSTLVRLNQATVSYEAALSASSKILTLSILDYIR